MALTRKLLKGMGLTEEQVDTIIEAHSETVDGLKRDVETYKKDAEELPEVRRQLENAQKDGGGNGEWKEKYDTLKGEYDTYKNETAAKETKAKKERAYCELLKKAGISEKRVGAIVKVTDLSGVELDDNGAIKDADKLAETVKTEWADFVVSTNTGGTTTATPPAGGTAGDPGAMNMADYIAWRNKS